MARQIINIGSSPNDGTGDSIRDGGDKINDNFLELYNKTGDGSGAGVGYAQTAGISTYATTAGIATYATTAGIATYATTAGIATYATTAGIATYAESAGIATYATTSGIATYATTAGIATYISSGFANEILYKNDSNISISTSNLKYFESISLLQIDGKIGIGTTVSTSNIAHIIGTTQDIVVSAGGTIGIGTDNPVSGLHLSGPDGSNLYLDSRRSDVPERQLIFDNGNTYAYLYLNKPGNSFGESFGWLDQTFANYGTGSNRNIFFYRPPEGTVQVGDTITVDIDNQKVGIGSTQPQVLLDINTVGAGTSAAVIFPRKTTAERDAMDALPGMVIYNTTTNRLNYYDGTNWRLLSSSIGA